MHFDKTDRKAVETPGFGSCHFIKWPELISFVRILVSWLTEAFHKVPQSEHKHKEIAKKPRWEYPNHQVQEHCFCLKSWKIETGGQLEEAQ